MSKKQNLDFIVKMLEKDDIKSPDSISADSIREKIENQKPPQNLIKLRRNKTPIKAMLATAACLAIVLTSTIGVSAASSKVVEKNGINYYTSYTAVEKSIRKIGNSGLFHNFGSVSDSKATSSELLAETDIMAVAPDGSDAVINEHSDTIVQEKGVDEADVIKTDGKYIYYLNDEKIFVFSVDSGKAQQVSKIDCKSGFFNDMYITDNYLTAIAYDYGSESGDDVEADKTIAFVYDITDRCRPELLYKNVQDGFYYSSRMIGTYVYTVSNYRTYHYTNRNIPYVTQNNKYERISCGDISGFTEPDEKSYTVISAMDITTGTSSIETKAVLGGSGNIYMSLDNLYITAGYDSLDIIKVSLDGTKIKLSGEAKISGYVNNQYSMSEKDGMLRVATTINTENGTANRIYVLSKDMKVVGKTKLFAKDESIKAVRYLGDMAYVITYEETDPLFIVDLKDAENPVITGEVMIDGFSSSLLPQGDDMLLGVGYDNDFDIKLVLFDIKDAKKPEIADTKVYKYCTGEVQYNIKALLKDDTYGYYAFFYEHVNYEDDSDSDNYSGIATFSVENGKIVKGINKKLKEKEGSVDITNIGRCVSVENYLYYLGLDSKMHSIKMGDKLVEDSVQEPPFSDEQIDELPTQDNADTQ